MQESATFYKARDSRLDSDRCNCCRCQSIKVFSPRIQNQDLIALEAWQTQTDLVRSLPPSDLAKLSNLAAQEFETMPAEIIQTPEEAAYLELQTKSDFHALKDQLRFMIKPELRREYEAAIETQASKSGYPALVPSNWQAVSDATVANLFWYFKGFAT